MKTLMTAVLLALAGCATERSVPPASRASVAATSETLTVVAEPGRSLDLVVMRPAGIRGVALFGHGQGGHASNYPALTKALADAGWLVVSPIHVDSRAHPRRADFDQRAGFIARVADVAAAAKAAETLAPGKPLVAVGHSYGALFAAMQGGASAMVPAREAKIRAVLAFSSPGRIPGLITPQSYVSLGVPAMVVTGDADIVPGFVPDWKQHLAIYEDSPAGGKYALIVKGGGHMLVNEVSGVERDRAVAAGLDFLAAYGLGDRAARTRLDALRSTVGTEVRRR